MNERIKELAEQAAKDNSDGYPVTLEYTNKFADKSAELIVWECAKTLTENQDPSWQQNYLAGWQAAAELLNKHIFKE